MDLKELLNTEDKGEKNRQLKRAFSSFTPFIVIDDCELAALITLINLTYSAKYQVDLCSIQSAKDALSNDKHFLSCVDQVNWLHTHNLKYPDARISHQRGLFSRPEKINGVLSSANVPHILGWSHDGAKVNHAKLFGANFRWRGEIMNLAQAVIEHYETWKYFFKKLGISYKRLLEIREQLEIYSPDIQPPKHVEFYSKQIRFPYLDDYCSITPVVSHAVQYQIQQYQTNSNIKTTIIKHTRPANIGDLTSSLAGNISALHYPPPIWLRYQNSFKQAKAYRLRHGFNLFNLTALYSTLFIHSLGIVAGKHLDITLKQRRKQRVAALRYIRKQLAYWVAPIMEWRDSMKENSSQLVGDDSIEMRLGTVELALLPSLIKPLNNLLHEQLQQNYKTSRFAYHPELLNPIKLQLAWLLNQLSYTQDEIEPNDTGIFYIHVNSLRIDNSQALANPYLVGIPSLTALGGMNHNYELRLQKLFSESITVIDCAWFIRRYSACEDKILPELSKIESDKHVTAVKRSGIMDSQLCDLTVDFIFRVQLDKLRLDDIDIEKFKVALPSRFAGGEIFPPLLNVKTPWLQHYSDKSLLFSVLSRLPSSGCWIVPTDSNVSSFDDLFDKLQQDTELKPIHVGFQALEQPIARSGALSKYHCYAESLIGVARCENPILVRLKGSNYLFEQLFWQHKISNGTILMVKSSL